MSLDTSDGVDVPLSPDDARRLINDPETPIDLYVHALRMLSASPLRMEWMEFRNQFLEPMSRDHRAFAPDSVRVILPWLVSIRGTLYESVVWLAHAPLSDEDLRTAEGVLAKDGYERADVWLRQLATSIRRRLARGDDEKPAAMRCLASLERVAQEAVSHKQDASSGYMLVEVLKLLQPIKPIKSWPVFDLLLAPGCREHLVQLCEDGRFDKRYQESSIDAVAEYVSDPECLSGDRADRIMALKSWKLDEVLARNPALPPEDAWRILIRYLKSGSPHDMGRVASGRAELLRFLLITDRSEAVAHALVHMERIPESVRASVAQEAMDFLKTRENTRYHEEHVRLMAGAVYRILGDSAGEALAKFRSDEVAKGLLDAWQGDDDRMIRALARHPRKAIRETLIPDKWRIERMDPKRKATLRDSVLPVLAEDRVKAIRAAAAQAMLKLSPESLDVLEVFRRAEYSTVVEVLRTVDRLPEGWLGILLERVRAPYAAVEGMKALALAADRQGLSLDDYKALATFRWDWLTERVVRNCAKAFPQAKEFFESLIDHGELTLAELSALEIWDVEVRAIFLNSRFRNVRQSLAANSTTLTRPEIIALLRDADSSVPNMLVRNRAWSHYVTLL